MKKILYVHHSTGLGGASISLINLIKGLDKSKFEFHVVLLKKSEVCDLLDENEIPYSIADCLFYNYLYVPFIHIVPSWFSIFTPFKFIYFNVSFLISKMFFSKRLLSKYDFDILHLNSLTLIDFLHKDKKYKSIIHVREPISEGHFGIRKGIFECLINKNADRVIAISEDNLNRIKINPDKGSVIYNWTRVIGGINERNNHNKSLLYIGGGVDFKGFDLLVHTLPIINSSVKVVCAGCYNETQIELLSKFSNVKVVGLVNNVSDYLKEATFLLNLFIDDHFARPIIEAYANGTPVIATPLDGTIEIVEHNVDGYIIKSFSPQALSNAIDYLLNSPNLVDKFRENAHAKALILFSEDNINKIEHIYHTV